MHLRAGTGVSHHKNPRVAGQEALHQALEAGRLGRADFVFAFASVGYDQQTLIRAIREASDGAPLCGCSAEGVIVGSEADESNFSVAVMAIESNRIRFVHGLDTGLKEDSKGCGGRLARALQPHLKEDARGLFLFPDGIYVNYDRLQEGIAENLPPGLALPFFGGSAGDNWHLKRTYQYCDDEVVSDGAAWALLSGDARLSWGVGHGYVPIGVEHQITRAQGNTIYEIDHRTVGEVLASDYFSAEDFEDRAKTLQTFTFGVKAPADMAGYDQYIIRSMVGGLNDKDGSVALATEIREGERLRVTLSDFDMVRDGNRRILRQVLARATADPVALAFQFECAGRGKVIMPKRIKVEMIEALRREIGLDVPWIGFYAYGEIGPVNGNNHFHNGSMVLVTLQ